MYTRWLLFPAAFGLVVHLIDLGYVKFIIFEHTVELTELLFLFVFSLNVGTKVIAAVGSPCFLCGPDNLGCTISSILET